MEEIVRKVHELNEVIEEYWMSWNQSNTSVRTQELLEQCMIQINTVEQLIYEQVHVLQGQYQFTCLVLDSYKVEETLVFNEKWWEIKKGLFEWCNELDVIRYALRKQEKEIFVSQWKHFTSLMNWYTNQVEIFLTNSKWIENNARERGV